MGALTPIGASFPGTSISHPWQVPTLCSYAPTVGFHTFNYGSSIIFVDFQRNNYMAMAYLHVCHFFNPQISHLEFFEREKDAKRLNCGGKSHRAVSKVSFNQH